MRKGKSHAGIDRVDVMHQNAARLRRKARAKSYDWKQYGGNANDCGIRLTNDSLSRKLQLLPKAPLYEIQGRAGITRLNCPAERAGLIHWSMLYE